MVGNLIDLPLRELLDRVASEELGSGGGSAVAVVVCLAVGTVAMAAGRASDEWPEAAGIMAQVEALRMRAQAQVQIGADAYAGAVRALADRGEGDDRALQDALDAAALAPLVVAEIAADVAALALVVAEHGRPEHRADAVAAAGVAAGAARSAAHFVHINLATVAGDAYDERARAAVAAATDACERAFRLDG